MPSITALLIALILLPALLAAALAWFAVRSVAGVRPGTGGRDTLRAGR